MRFIPAKKRFFQKLLNKKEKKLWEIEKLDTLMKMLDRNSDIPVNLKMENAFIAEKESLIKMKKNDQF